MCLCDRERTRGENTLIKVGKVTTCGDARLTEGLQTVPTTRTWFYRGCYCIRQPQCARQSGDSPVPRRNHKQLSSVAETELDNPFTQHTRRPNLLKMTASYLIFCLMVTGKSCFCLLQSTLCSCGRGAVRSVLARCVKPSSRRLKRGS